MTEPTYPVAADRRGTHGRRVIAILAACMLTATACTDTPPTGAPATGTAATGTPATGPATAAWTPVWSEDFDGAANTKLSAEDWIYSKGSGYRGGAKQWGTGEIETMTDSPANVRLDGAGHLVITPIRTGAGAGRWTSGRVETRRTDFAAPPGGAVRMEASLKLPDVSGPQAAGYWSAFWALGAPARPVGATNWPHIGEWDVMEHVNGLDSVWHTLHCGTPVGGPCGETTGLSSGQLPCPGCRTGFHTFALEYDRGVAPEELRWYVDGRNTFSVRADRVDEATWAAANHHGFFIILNVAIGGAFPAAFGGGPTPATKSGVPMLVDRVAVQTRAG
ncbi:MAG TPA: glycoside hydrolase family 16 protein [Actinoplanes sp.]